MKNLTFKKSGKEIKKQLIIVLKNKIDFKAVYCIYKTVAAIKK